MEKNGLIARKKTRFVTTTQADPNHRSALWVSDITLIPTDEGNPYLAATMDLWSRMIVGWAIRESMQKSLVQQAFDMAVQQR